MNEDRAAKLIKKKKKAPIEARKLYQTQLW